MRPQHPHGGCPNPSQSSQSTRYQSQSYSYRDITQHFEQLSVTTPEEKQKTTQTTEGTQNPQSTKPFIFEPMCVMDIEMTDMDPYKGKIAEIACYLVSGDLRQQILIASLVIKLNLESDVKSDEVVKRFTKSGLWQDLNNPEKVTPLLEAEELIIKQFEEYGITAKQIPSAGIQSYNDRIVLEKQMPSFNNFLNFTIIDISSVDEVASRWSKRIFNKREAKESRHRAEPNARRAITRLQYYKANLFKNQGSPSQTPYPERMVNQFYQDSWSAPWGQYVQYEDQEAWDASAQTQQQKQSTSTHPLANAGKPAFYPGQNFFGDRE